jgi:hypothetical protein
MQVVSLRVITVNGLIGSRPVTAVGSLSCLAAIIVDHPG